MVRPPSPCKKCAGPATAAGTTSLTATLTTLLPAEMSTVYRVNLFNASGLPAHTSCAYSQVGCGATAMARCQRPPRILSHRLPTAVAA